ncbi:SinI family restriction endonuclease [Burkholderia cepacia]|uniref:SinI family restriction endonuclease n=1 Tax=Burkholderia cepacia TaxID=292 RepID=UPI000F582E53|nr:SinI family restriction endonuclease [Burkholderia cepacia]RQT62363.1 SinI family restriction endonuclease [Burkholderia cepacia]
MTFVANASGIAREVMEAYDHTLVEKFVTIIEFLASHPHMAITLKGTKAPAIGSVEYIDRLAKSFVNERGPRAPKEPSTVPDAMVSVILVSYFNINQDDAERIKREHLLSMGAENMVGHLLERYLASVLEPRGWVWCSGSIVKSVDFIKPSIEKNGIPKLIQVKNRDNSENSSSSAVRLGTPIEKWHRSFSRREETNWGAFPDIELRKLLNESGFKKFVENYLHERLQ